MKSVADLLREGDPIAAEPALPDGDARRMRQLVLAHHAGAGSQAGMLWRGVAVLASMALAALALGTWLANTRSASPSARVAQVDAASINADSVAAPQQARQVQFVTPRGTRVVWVLQADTPGQEGIR